jgi:hypothetical protein
MSGGHEATSALTRLRAAEAENERLRADIMGLQSVIDTALLETRDRMTFDVAAMLERALRLSRTALEQKASK